MQPPDFYILGDNNILLMQDAWKHANLWVTDEAKFPHSSRHRCNLFYTVSDSSTSKGCGPNLPN